MKLIYDRKLDKDKTLEKKAKYFDEVNSSEAFDFTRAVRKKGEIRKVNMMLPLNIYVDALMIGKMVGSGYQDALRMAIAIGMKKLKRSMVSSN